MTLNLNKDEEDPSTSYALKSQTKFNRNETEKTFGNDTSKRSPKKDVKFLETPVYKNQYPILAKANKEKFKIAPKVEKVEPIPIIAIEANFYRAQGSPSKSFDFLLFFRPS